MLGERFFHVNIPTRLTGKYRWNRVPMVRRGNNHGVEIVAVENTAKILRAFRPMLPLLLDDLNSFRDLGVIHVANHGEIHFGVGEKRGEIAPAHSAAADDTDANFVIRADGGLRFAGTQNQSAERRHRGGSKSGFFQKFSASERVHSCE